MPLAVYETMWKGREGDVRVYSVFPSDPQKPILPLYVLKTRKYYAKKNFADAALPYVDEQSQRLEPIHQSLVDKVITCSPEAEAFAAQRKIPETVKYLTEYIRRVLNTPLDLLDNESVLFD